MRMIPRWIESLAVLVVVLVVLAPLAGRAAQDDGVMPVVFSGRMAGDDQSIRFFINSDRPVHTRAYYMDQPLRVVVDLEEVRFNLGEDGVFEPRGMVEQVQFGRISQGRSRIVLKLKSPVEIEKSEVRERTGEAGYRYLLDLKAVSPQRFAHLLQKQRENIGTSGVKARKGDRLKPVKKSPDRFTIVLDPGHGGIDGGAVGRSGTREKDLTLAFARVLKNRIESAGPFDVLMTREEDVFLTLRERLDFSERHQADLFISLHADSLSQRFVRGSTVYTLSKKASDRLSERLAEAENAVDLIGGVAITSPDEAVTDILFDLTARETKQFSRQFSKRLVENLKGRVRLIKNPLRSAAFGVLKAPTVPSVLMEMGYLSNPEDEKLLRSAEWQDKAATATVSAISQFFETRQ